MSSIKFQHNSGFIEKASIDEIIIKNEKKYAHFQRILDVFKKSKKGEKLMKNKYYDVSENNMDENKYYLLENGYFQSSWRWWYGENKENTKEYIEEEMHAFIKFLDELSRENQKYSYYSTYQKFIEKIIIYIGDILPGLYSFKETYPEYKDLISLIDSIILTLIDFKNTAKKKTK